MTTLRELCYNLDCQIFGDKNINIKGISCHSQKTKPSDLFVAIDGHQTSGKKFIESAISAGASSITTSDKTLALKLVNQSHNRVSAIYTKNPRRFLAMAANRFFDFPSKKLNLIGITGTDGKTTTSYMIKSIIEASGQKTGLLGTIKYYDGKSWLFAPNTTPESLELIQFLHNLIKQGIRHCISEVSSHALALDRVYGLDFKVAVFTNLAQDHLDFHKTKKAYGEAKLKLFQNLSRSAYAIVNIDDKFSKSIIRVTKAKVFTYSLTPPADISAQIKSIKADGINTIINLKRKPKTINITLPMLGRHNVSNMLAAIATAKAIRISDKFIKQGLEQLKPIAGRLEKIKTNEKYNIYVDYAHTAEALELAIRTLREVTKEKVIVVFGCGGNRDCGKRPRMGRIATELSDYVIVTSDNPRHEKPEAIIEDIKKGIKENNFEIIINRALAIRKAIALVKPNDTILVAGKGHEDHQIIGDKKIYFSDKKVILTELKKRP